MVSSSPYHFVFVSLAVLLPFLFVSASATKFIDGICLKLFNHKDKAFCYKQLNAYHPAASATSELKAAQAAISLSISYADKYYAFVEKAARTNPGLKKELVECLDAFKTISFSLKSVLEEILIDPQTANYDASICYDQTARVHNSIGKNTDKVSKSIITVTLMTEKYINIAIGATAAVGG